jgi:D-3-phosphoglycerate dehydrogenase
MNAQDRVVITDYTFPTLDIEREVISSVGAVVEDYQCKSEEDVVAAVRGAKVVLAQFAPIGRPALEVLAEDATVVRYGVGVDNIDVQAAQELGISVAYVPDYCVDEVADHTAALLLALLRKVKVFDEGVRSGDWGAVGLAKPLLPLKKTIIGLVGLGRIGRAVLERLRPFGVRFIVYDPFLSLEEASELGISLTDLEPLLAESDAISLHVPLTQETTHLLDRERMSSMKSNAVVVNTARGALIDPDALAEALETGDIGGAALDVFEEEPLPPESPLRDLSNILLSPHAAWYSEDSMPRLQRLVAEEAARALQKEPLRCPI